MTPVRIVGAVVALLVLFAVPEERRDDVASLGFVGFLLGVAAVLARNVIQ